jgi:hypothetical protein
MAAAGTVAQIPVDFGHGRSREAGQMKEDDERIPFHTLLTAGTHRGDRILRRKEAAAFCFVHLLLAAAAEAGEACWGGTAHGGGRGAGRPVGAWHQGASQRRGTAPWWPAALLAGVHGCSTVEERRVGAVRLVAHRSKRGSRKQCRGLGDGGGYSADGAQGRAWMNTASWRHTRTSRRNGRGPGRSVMLGNREETAAG